MNSSCRAACSRTGDAAADAALSAASREVKQPALRIDASWARSASASAVLLSAGAANAARRWSAATHSAIVRASSASVPSGAPCAAASGQLPIQVGAQTRFDLRGHALRSQVSAQPGAVSCAASQMAASAARRFAHASRRPADRGVPQSARQHRADPFGLNFGCDATTHRPPVGDDVTAGLAHTAGIHTCGPVPDEAPSGLCASATAGSTSLDRCANPDAGRRGTRRQHTNDLRQCAGCTAASASRCPAPEPSWIVSPAVVIRCGPDPCLVRSPTPRCRWRYIEGGVP